MGSNAAELVDWAGDQMAFKVEVVVDLGMNIGEFFERFRLSKT